MERYFLTEYYKKFLEQYGIIDRNTTSIKVSDIIEGLIKIIKQEEIGNEGDSKNLQLELIISVFKILLQKNIPPLKIPK
ncbi:hypothetical protein HGA92_03620 [Candidatus Gracilibacteria bacterium]|nr:hypothetical protein [Candidatus Gracilibacteria bacterium]NUJ99187.1 hypothetical protein [Candidatus Gracilibacteria bacterium]